MSEEEEPDGGQDGEDEVRPVVLEGGAVQRRGREEVAEEDQVDHRRHDVHQDLLGRQEGQYHAALIKFNFS